MLVIAAQTLRGRWRLSVGSFVALAFGVAVAGSAGLLMARPGISEDEAALLSVLGSLSFFVAIFVVAGTYAFSVEQRRRELALMRAVGATPRQIRRLVVGETLLVGALASVAGCVLAAPLSMLLRRQMASLGFGYSGAPVSRLLLTLGVTFCLGLFVARVAVGPASRRAGLARPVEALRSVTIEGRVMTRGRWITGGLFLVGAVAQLVAIPWVSQVAVLGISASIAEILVVALAALTPVFVPPLARLAGRPLTALTRASGGLALASIRMGVRRCASTAAPVLATVGILGSFAGLTATAVASNERDNRNSLLAAVIVDPVAGGSLPASSIDDASGLGAVRVAVPIPTAEVEIVKHDEDGEYLVGPYALVATDLGGLAEVARLRVRAGDLADVGGQDVAVTSLAAAELGARLGDTLPIATPGREGSSLRVVAVVDLPPAIPADFLTVVPDVAGWPVTRLLVATDGGADAGAVAAEIQAAVGTSGRVATTADWITEDARQANRSSWLGIALLLGAPIVFTVIAIANTQLMAAGQRAGDVARLRRVGATPAQTVRMVVWETCACVAVGTIAGAITAMVSTTGVWWALRLSNPYAVLRVPWLAFLGVVTLCLLVAVATAIGSVLRSARANGPARVSQD